MSHTPRFLNNRHGRQIEFAAKSVRMRLVRRTMK